MLREVSGRGVHFSEWRRSQELFGSLKRVGGVYRGRKELSPIHGGGQYVNAGRTVLEEKVSVFGGGSENFLTRVKLKRERMVDSRASVGVWPSGVLMVVLCRFDCV